ncbi:protein EFR3 homolog cmp44E isoform X4 [Bombyx mori]|uniref:protein EFR3 homolog cmp44E isoform X4 n=1 Tax=Bombyx mori TaxID=7091 RepID=UPI002ED428F0
MAQGCCGCCSALRPRYKRLVDNIFPASPQDGLVKSNMEKLTFYSLSSPEKLDRIGEYLFQKASRDIYRRRHGFVIIAMEAMDQLLVACHSQTLNLFVESFLKMVQKLLESTDPQLQILATQSFVRFANIEEDTPSYHRRYDFFVSKFSAMCHSNHGEPGPRDRIRLAGIQGLQGVIRKTVSDDLVENIWEAQHMDKIVPSLLYNMQSAEKYETVSCAEGGGAGGEEGEEESPPRLAEACLRDLLARASFGHIRSVLRPVLTHFDRHDLWIPTDFAVHVFKIIMFSIQAQYSYSVVEALMQQLEAGRGGVRAARAAVLAAIVGIAAGDSVGPSVLEIINNILTNLRASVARGAEKETEEKLYQEALINALGEFADHLPDYQKIDIMMFIVNKVPGAAKPSRADAMLQHILLKSLLKVGATYKTTELSKAFPAAFLEALLRLSSATEPSTRVLLQRILHTLLDRRDNVPRLAVVTLDYDAAGLSVEKCSRQDLIFISKHGYAIFSALYEGLQLESNSTENIACIYTTIALLCVELAADDTLCDLMLLILAIQQSSISNPVLSVSQQCQLQAVSISLAALLPHVAKLPRLADYIHKVVEARREECGHLLPPLQHEYRLSDPTLLPAKVPYLMMDQMAISECLKASGVECGRLQGAAPYCGGGPLQHRHSWIETGAAAGRDSLADIAAGTEPDSAASSPTLARRSDSGFWFRGHEDDRASTSRHGRRFEGDTQAPAECAGVSLEALRRAAEGGSGAERRDAAQRRRALNLAFRTAPFHHLMQVTQPKYEIQEKLEEIFRSVSEEPLLAPSLKSGPPLPDLCLY